MLGETADFRPARRIAEFTRAQIIGFDPTDPSRAASRSTSSSPAPRRPATVKQLLAAIRKAIRLPADPRLPGDRGHLIHP